VPLLPGDIRVTVDGTQVDSFLGTRRVYFSVPAGARVISIRVKNAAGAENVREETLEASGPPPETGG